MKAHTAIASLLFLLALILAVFAQPLATPAAPDVPQVNLLTNGGFESGQRTPWDGGVPNGGSAHIVTDPVYSGHFALLVEGGNNNFGGVYGGGTACGKYVVEIQPLHFYNFSSYVYVPAPPPPPPDHKISPDSPTSTAMYARVLLEWYPDCTLTNRLSANTLGDIAGPSGGFVQLSGKVSSPAGAHYLKISLLSKLYYPYAAVTGKASSDSPKAEPYAPVYDYLTLSDAGPYQTPTATPTRTPLPTLTPRPAPGSCQAFNWINQVNVAVGSGNALSKTAGGGGWNAGATSNKQFPAGQNGAAQMTVADLTHYVLFGLSNGNSSASFNDIDFGLETYAPANQLWVQEKGRVVVKLNGYAVGDVLRVAAYGNSVRYYRNGSLIYSSSGVPTYPLLFDSSFYDVGGQIKNPQLCSGPLQPVP